MTQQKLQDAQRNDLANNPMSQAGFFTSADEMRPHPAELLFKMDTIQELVIKSDIPEKMVNIITRMLWKSDRYNIDALEALVKQFLLVRLGKDRLARREFMEVLMKMKEPGEDEEALT